MDRAIPPGRPSRRWATGSILFVCYLAEIGLMVLLGAIVSSVSKEAAAGVIIGAFAMAFGCFFVRQAFAEGAWL